MSLYGVSLRFIPYLLQREVPRRVCGPILVVGQKVRCIAQFVEDNQRGIFRFVHHLLMFTLAQCINYLKASRPKRDALLINFRSPRWNGEQVLLDR